MFVLHKIVEGKPVAVSGRKHLSKYAVKQEKKTFAANNPDVELLVTVEK